MIVVTVAAALAGLGLITQAGVVVLNDMHPAAGKIIGVAGARIYVVDIGPRDSGLPPIVMIHGASSNLETMRLPVGDMLAKNRRVILIDRPGHGWSSRDLASDSAPSVQARMIDEALDKLGVTGAIFVVHSWTGSLGALMALNYPQRVAGLVMLAPVVYPWPGEVGTYNKARHQAGDRTAAGLHHHAAIGVGLGRVWNAHSVPAAGHAARLRQDRRDLAAVQATRVSCKCVGHRHAQGGGRRAGAALRNHQGSDGCDTWRRRQNGIAEHPFPPVRRSRTRRETDRAARRGPHGAERRAGPGCQ